MQACIYKWSSEVFIVSTSFNTALSLNFFQRSYTQKQLSFTIIKKLVRGKRVCRKSVIFTRFLTKLCCSVSLERSLSVAHWKSLSIITTSWVKVPALAKSPSAQSRLDSKMRIGQAWPQNATNRLRCGTPFEDLNLWRLPERKESHSRRIKQQRKDI